MESEFYVVNIETGEFGEKVIFDIEEESDAPPKEEGQN